MAESNGPIANPPHTPASRAADWPRAWRALRALIADPERTDRVAEFIVAVGGGGDLRALARFRAHPGGKRLLAERPSLSDVLSDLPRLAAFPAGSFGRAYAEFMQSEKLNPTGIVDEFRALEDAAIAPPIDPDERWFFERLDVTHDLWHVLTGYGRDEAGEAANLAFTLAQYPTRAVAFLVLAAALIGPKDWRASWPRYLYHAWRRGRRAAYLIVAPYEVLLPLPLEDVRTLLSIQPAAEAHPLGIIVGQRNGATSPSGWGAQQRTAP
jgi:ubiquinone biosynthesis protein COQ4